jgi:hypothetical protein
VTQVDQHSQSPDGSDEEGGGLDLEKIRGYVRFVRGSLWRRKLLFASVLILGIGGTYLAYWMMPRSYHCEVQLLAHNQPGIGDLTGRPGDQGSPTQAAAEMVLRRDNLVALVEKADLLTEWSRSRSRIGQLKDWLRAKLGRFTSDEDKIEQMVGTLELSLSVNTKITGMGEGMVNIAVDWPDPKMAYRLVTAAQQGFVEARHLADISNISEALSILIARANAIGREIESTASAIDERRMEQLGKKHPHAEPGERTERRTHLTPTPDSLSASSDKEGLLQVQSMWEAKKSAVKDLEDMRRRRIAELQTKLAEQRAVYADSHPAIVETLQTIETMKQESPELTQLRKEESALHSQYLSLAASSKAASGDTTTPDEPATQKLRPNKAAREVAEPSVADDREMSFAKAQLRVRTDTYDGLLIRIENAHMEMETTRAAFKYRFVVVKPAQVPHQPDKPKAPKVLGGGFAASLVLAMLLAIAADLRTGRVYAAWQLERALRLPVLAEIRRSR